MIESRQTARPPTTLGIDAALRKTGLALLGPDFCYMKTVKYPKGDIERLWEVAVMALSEIIGIDDVVGLAVIERHPWLNRPKRGEVRSRDLPNTLGIASGIWLGAARKHGLRVKLASVAEMRSAVLLGMGSGGGKAKAKALTTAFCKAHGFDPPADIDQAEALCHAIYGRMLLATEVR